MGSPEIILYRALAAGQTRVATDHSSTTPWSPLAGGCQPTTMTKNGSHTPSKSSYQIAQTRLRYFEERRDQMIETIRRLVDIESPSDNKQAVDRCSAFAAEEIGRASCRE